MTHKIPFFREWIKPYEKRCEKAGIKFTNKNRQKLKDTAYIPLCIKVMGPFNGLAYAVYADSFVDLIPDLNYILRDRTESASLYHQPVILGIEHGVVFKGEKDEVPHDSENE